MLYGGSGEILRECVDGTFVLETFMNIFTHVSGPFVNIFR